MLVLTIFHKFSIIVGSEDTADQYNTYTVLPSNHFLVHFRIIMRWNTHRKLKLNGTSLGANYSNMIDFFRYCRNFSTNRHWLVFLENWCHLQVVNVFLLPALPKVSIDGTDTFPFFYDIAIIICYAFWVSL